MKTMIASLILVAAGVSNAAQLNCWKTNFKTPKKPYLTAEIAGNNTLKDITFNYKNDTDNSVAGRVKGKTIVTNHSPYKGSVEYILKNEGYMDRLILPANLSNRALVSIEKSDELVGGLGHGENGAAIGHTDDGEGGGHLSARLSCRSTND